MTRTPLSKVKRSRSPGRFAHRRVGASGGCSGGRENVLAVGDCCFVAVCSAAQCASAPTGDRGAGLGHTVAAPTRLQFVNPRTLTVNYNLLSIRGRLLSIPLLHLAEHFRTVSLYTCRFSFKNSTIHRTEIICLVTSKTARLISDF